MKLQQLCACVCDKVEASNVFMQISIISASYTKYAIECVRCGKHN